MSNMTIRKYIFIFLTLSVLLAGIGYIVANPAVFGLESWLCDWYQFGSEVRCYESYELVVGQPLLLFFAYVSASLLLLIFMSHAYKIWCWVTAVVLPIMLIIVVLTPVYGEDFGPLPPRAQMAEFLGQVFLVVSVLVIGISWFWSGQTEKTKDQNN